MQRAAQGASASHQAPPPELSNPASRRRELALSARPMFKDDLGRSTAMLSGAEQEQAVARRGMEAESRRCKRRWKRRLRCRCSRPWRAHACVSLFVAARAPRQRPHTAWTTSLADSGAPQSSSPKSARSSCEVCSPAASRRTQACRGAAAAASEAGDAEISRLPARLLCGCRTVMHDAMIDFECANGGARRRPISCSDVGMQRTAWAAARRRGAGSVPSDERRRTAQRGASGPSRGGAGCDCDVVLCCDASPLGVPQR
jgi:hypothetical protein